MTTPQGPQKPRVRGPATWRRKGCTITYGTLLCFGIPLLPPSAILLGLAFGTQSTFGIFHICGLLLTFISMSCITLAILLVSVRARMSGASKKVPPESPVPAGSPGTRPDSPSSQSSSSGSRSFRMGKMPVMTIDNEAQGRSRKKRKRKHGKHGKHSKLPPVKEEDGRLKFEKAIEERAKAGRVHKRTKSETRKGVEEDTPEPSCPKTLTLTHKHLQMLNRQHQGSQSSLQMKRSLSMSDIGDSASERLSIDFSDSPRTSRRTETGRQVTARFLYVHSVSRTTGQHDSRAGGQHDSRAGGQHDSRAGGQHDGKAAGQTNNPQNYRQCFH